MNFWTLSPQDTWTISCFKVYFVHQASVNARYAFPSCAQIVNTGGSFSVVVRSRIFLVTFLV